MLLKNQNTDLIRIRLEEDTVHGGTQGQIVPRFTDHASWWLGLGEFQFLLAVRSLLLPFNLFLQLFLWTFFLWWGLLKTLQQIRSNSNDLLSGDQLWCRSISNAVHNFPLTKILSSVCWLVPKHFECYSQLSTHQVFIFRQSADWRQSISNAIHNFPLTKFLSSNRLQTGAKAFQMLFISFHSPSFYLQMVCRLLCGNMCPMFGIPVPPPCHVLNLMMVFDKFDSLWLPYMRDVGHMKQTCSGILFCDINRPQKIGWLKKLVMLLCVGIVWHLLESIGESTWPFLSKQWLVVEALHSKNIDLFSLIVDTATDCIDCPSTHRSKSVLHTFCHCSNQNSCTEFLILVTVMAASYYWSKKLLGKLRIPCQVLSPRQPFWDLSYTLHD